MTILWNVLNCLRCSFVWRGRANRAEFWWFVVFEHRGNLIRNTVLAITLVFTTIPAAARAQIAGQADVIDGDTLVVAGKRIRLSGIDAPESDQTCRTSGGRSYRCGASATRALRKRIAGRRIECEERSRDRWGRFVAVCRTGGEDLNAWMVTQGHAVAYRRYSTAYVEHERRAKAARRGLWQGDFVTPRRWRAGVRLEGSETRSHTKRSPRTGPRIHRGPRTSNDTTRNRPEHTRPDTCRIKGNISRGTGEKIYHVPGGRYYEQTRIETRKGERWFCSETQARRAGWRRSKR